MEALFKSLKGGTKSQCVANWMWLLIPWRLDNFLLVRLVSWGIPLVSIGSQKKKAAGTGRGMPSRGRNPISLPPLRWNQSASNRSADYAQAWNERRSTWPQRYFPVSRAYRSKGNLIARTSWREHKRTVARVPNMAEDAHGRKNANGCVEHWRRTSKDTQTHLVECSYLDRRVHTLIDEGWATFFNLKLSIDATFRRRKLLRPDLFFLKMVSKINFYRKVNIKDLCPPWVVPKLFKKSGIGWYIPAIRMSRLFYCLLFR